MIKNPFLMERLCPERKVHPRARYFAQSDELLRFLLFFTLILFSHFDLMSSQAFLRSIFASEEELESESLLESDSLDELSFFFFFFFDTFFCFLAFFAFFFLSSSLSESSLSSFLDFFSAFFFLTSSLSESSLSSFFGFLLRLFLLFSLTVGIVVTVSATSFLFLLLTSLAIRV